MIYSSFDTKGYNFQRTVTKKKLLKVDFIRHGLVVLQMIF